MNCENSIEEILRQSPPCPLNRIRGKIISAKPRIPIGRGSIQNFMLLDEVTKKKIRAAYWDLPQELVQYEGGYLEVEAESREDHESIAWKPQVNASGQKQDPKVEIKKTARIVIFLKAADYHGELTLAPLRRPPASSLQQVPVPELFPRPAGPGERPAGMAQTLPFPQSSNRVTTEDALKELRQLTALYRLSIEETTSLHADLTASNISRPPLADQFDRDTERLYAAAVSHSLHKRLASDGSADQPSAGNTPPARPNVDRLQLLVEQKGMIVETVLRGLGLITSVQTWRDLDEQNAMQFLNGEQAKVLLAS